MAGGLDSIDCVEGVLTELLCELHEVSCYEGDLFLETRLLGVLPRALDLEIIIVEPNDGSIGECRDLAGGSTDTTPDVEDTHSGTQAHVRREVVLVAGERRKEGLALVGAREVERIGPAVLVQLCGTVVIT